MNAQNGKQAVWLSPALHRDLARYAERKGLTLTAAADALLQSGLNRARALKDYRVTKRVVKKFGYSVKDFLK